MSTSAASAAPPRRCKAHELALGPDGLCVVCHRGGSVVERPSASSAWTASTGLILLAVVLGGAIAYRELTPLREKTVATAGTGAAAEMRNVPVRMFSASWCPSCRKAKAWMQENDVAFTEIDIEASNDSMREARRLNPAGTIPTIDVDGEVVVGFDARRIETAIGAAAERRRRVR